MTKLVQFLLKLAVFVSFWVVTLLYLQEVPCYNYVFVPLPFYALVLFGVSTVQFFTYTLDYY
jgi:hypothetical protein